MIYVNIVLVIGVLLFQPYIICKLYNWYLMEFFKLGTMTYLTAFMIMFIVKFTTSVSRLTPYKFKCFYEEEVTYRFSLILVYCLAILIVGYIFKIN